MASENPLSAALLSMLMPAGRLDTNRNELFAGCGVADFFDHQSSDSPKIRAARMTNPPPSHGYFFECDVVKGGQARAEPLKLGAVLAIAAIKVLVAP